MGMLRYVIRRLFIIIPMLFILSFALFLVLYLQPGDPARRIAPERVTENQLEAIRAAYGMDQPLYVQYLRWMIGWPPISQERLEQIPPELRDFAERYIPDGILRGDLGWSWRHQSPIIDLIKPRILKTLELTVLAFFISLAIGFSLGILAALKRATILDYLSTTGALFGLSMPNFWLMLMLILIFSMRFGWFGATYDTGLPILMPALVLGTSHAASVARLSRSSMLEVLGQDYIRTARVKGVPEGEVIWKHALRNALIPVVTILALRIPWLFAGTVVLEEICGISGMGRLLFRSIYPHHDYLVVQVQLLMFVVLVSIANLIADILYAYINPKIRYE